MEVRSAEEKDEVTKQDSPFSYVSTSELTDTQLKRRIKKYKQKILSAKAKETPLAVQLTREIPDLPKFVPHNPNLQNTRPAVTMLVTEAKGKK